MAFTSYQIYGFSMLSISDQAGIFGLFVILMQLTTGCLQHRSPESIHDDPEVSELTQKNSFEAQPGQNLSSDEEAKEKINAAQLQVMRISIATISVNGTQFKKLIYIRDGKSEFVEYEICAQSLGICKSGKEVSNEMMVPIFVEDTILIKLRACVGPEHSQNPEKNCGSWSVHDFKQYNPIGITLQKKIETKSELYHRMISFGTPVSMVFSNFLIKKKECLNSGNWSEGWEDIMKVWLTSGPALIGMSLAESDGSELLNTGGLSGHGVESSNPGSIRYKIADVLEESNKSLIKMNNKNGTKYKVILATGAHGLRVLYQQIFQYITSSGSECPLWIRTAQDLEIIEKKLLPIRSEYRLVSDNIDNLLNP